MAKVIVSCAVTGAIHTPSMSPHLPVTPDQIAAAAIGAGEAGAAIIHLHARDPGTGRPEQTPDAFRRFLPAIAAGSDCILNITTGGGLGMSVAERVRPAAELAPELASLNMGSMNFATFPMLDRYPELQHAWERPYLEGTRDHVFKNTIADMEHILERCTAGGTRFEFECYDTAHLYTLAWLLDQRRVVPPLFVQTVFGILGGIGTHPDDLAHLRRTADRLFGNAYHWSVLAAGRHQLPLATMAVAMGGHCRVGLEDSLWDGPGRLAPSNAAQVHRIRGIIEGLGLQLATPAEARAMLNLKGKVTF